MYYFQPASRYRLALVTVGLLATASTSPARGGTAVPTNFTGYGTTVNGYQDFFTGTTFNPGWKEISNGAVVTPGSSGNFTLPGDGTLHINGGAGDPNKLLYSGATYDAANQNVLAMIDVTSAGSGGDGFRGGVAAVSDPANGQGINLLFRAPGQNGTGNHFNFLDDSRAWGPEVDIPGGWQTGTYYWLRLTTSGSGTATSETGEIWPADGTTPESSATTGTWGEGNRSGLAGLVADSIGGNGTFQVNYALIQSPGLPAITAGVAPTPEPASLALLGLGGLALMARRRRTA